ncbi:MAG: hypothetical protein KA105_02505 [Caulobacter sp.]|nr:hypothetical protein [Caulobacter sp.]
MSSSEYVVVPRAVLEAAGHLVDAIGKRVEDRDPMRWVVPWKEAENLQRELSALAAASPSTPRGKGEADMRRVCEALGFDPTNHHNAAKCPYCTPEAPTPTLGSGEAEPVAWPGIKGICSYDLDAHTVTLVTDGEGPIWNCVTSLKVAHRTSPVRGEG